MRGMACKYFSFQYTTVTLTNVYRFHYTPISEKCFFPTAAQNVIGLAFHNPECARNQERLAAQGNFAQSLLHRLSLHWLFGSPCLYPSLTSSGHGKTDRNLTSVFLKGCPSQVYCDTRIVSILHRVRPSPQSDICYSSFIQGRKGLVLARGSLS